MTALFFLLHWRLGGLDLRVIMVNVARTLLATTALCAVAYPVRCALDSLLPHLGVKLHAIIVLGAGSAAGLSAFLAVAVLLRMPELRSAIRLVRRTK
jgi:peptidoglycan biosynthesis protein MviN/MurJ (putative lipid II flippase)